jgi:hypothetical protein
MLTDEHDHKLMGAALSFLEHYHREGDEFLDHIITGDETWIGHYTQRISGSLKNGIMPTFQEKKHKNSSRHVQLQKSWPAFF